MTKHQKQVRAVINKAKTFLDQTFPNIGCFRMLYEQPYFGQAGTWNRSIYRDSQLLYFLLIKRMRKYNEMLPKDLKVIYYHGYDDFYEAFEKEIPKMNNFPELNEEY